MRARSNSDTAQNVARADPESAAYAQKVAVPVMEAVDQMPGEYRVLVNEFGYVDVYRAWRRGMTPTEIRRNSTSGFFKL